MKLLEPAANNEPTGVPTITGTARVGQTLTANTSGIGDADGLGTFSYQWIRGAAADIAGATASTYQPVAADVGQTLKVRVSWTDGAGTAESLDSAPTAVVTAANNEPTGLPSISGTARVGQTLTANTSGIGDADGLGTFSYQWIRGAAADIAGASASTYQPVAADVGQTLKVRVSWTDGAGTAESLDSAPTAVVTAANNEPTGVPSISGTARVGQTLTANTSGIGDADGLGTFSYQWIRGAATDIAGASASTYQPVAADVGQTLKVRVSWTDGAGTAESLDSAPTAVVTAANNEPTGVPSISGTARVGQTLTANTSGIGDADGLGTFSYQWIRGAATDIAGASASTYQPVAADVGQTLKVRVSWTDGAGTAESLDSAPTAVVTAADEPPTDDDGVVWSATLTARDVTTGILGCANSTAGAYCSSTSNLSDDDFTHASTDYEIIQIYSSGQ